MMYVYRCTICLPLLLFKFSLRVTFFWFHLNGGVNKNLSHRSKAFRIKVVSFCQFFSSSVTYLSFCIFYVCLFWLVRHCLAPMGSFLFYEKRYHNRNKNESRRSLAKLLSIAKSTFIFSSFYC